MEDEILNVLAEGLKLLGERYLEAHGARADGLAVVRTDQADGGEDGGEDGGAA